MMDLKGKRVLVVGLGKSGVASALFLAERGAQVAVSDAKSPEQLARGDSGAARSGHQRRDRAARRAHLPRSGPDRRQPRRAVRCSAIGACSRARDSGDRRGGIGGAIPEGAGSSPSPVRMARPRPRRWQARLSLPAEARRWSAEISELRRSRFVDRSTDDTWVVLEISSFQLETIETFHPQIAVVLNITPDHLDRHHTFENYAAAKARIFENQTAADFAVLNADNEPCVADGGDTKAAGALVQPAEGSRERSVCARRASSGAMTKASARSCRSARFR